MKEKVVPFSRVTVYESSSRFYLVGSNMAGSQFCLLKIDRSEDKALVFSNGDHEYTKKELNEVLAMIHGSNASLSKTSPASVLTERITNAKGLLGFVRFLEGYYVIIITKATLVAQLGFHRIYKIDETEMIYVPSKSETQQNNAEEQRYVKLFQSVDLATNFYFSYTYDLTRTLQANISRPRSDCYEKFVWNSYLLQPMIEKGVSGRWLLPVVHGFLGVCSFSIKGFTFRLILLARRSNKFAGTRFLKRGANNRGYVANEVETEQILYDSSISSFERGRFTSFVQLRGSVPLVWSQDIAKVVGKPPIQLDCVDPFAVIPALHFQELRARYRNPIVVINLMKRRERRRQESILNDEFRTSISYLNQFLDPTEAILYLSFDMARCHKTGNVLPKLEEIGYNVLKSNGWFQTFPTSYFHRIRPGLDDEFERRACDQFQLQTGVPRTNCVDCLDRTNVAQFVIGKVALSYQLYALGLLDTPRLGLETEICRLLESLFEQHGDTLALQYAGSQLVHSIRTYKKISLFQERSRDVIQTLSRYYSNTFSDYDKQDAINLFLGLFRASSSKPQLWELPNDWTLHNPFNCAGLTEFDYCAWFELQEGYYETRTIKRELKAVAPEVAEENEIDGQMDDFDRFYRTFEFTSLDVLVVKEQREVAQIDSATSPPTLGGQPFMKLLKKQDANGSRMQRRKSQDVKRGGRKQRVTRAAGDENDPDDSSSEEEAAHSDTEIQYSAPWNGVCTSGTPPDRRFDDAEVGLEADSDDRVYEKKHRVVTSTNFLRFESMLSVYGTEVKVPSRMDMFKYERYVELASQDDESEEKGNYGLRLGTPSKKTYSAELPRWVRRFMLGDTTTQQQNVVEADSGHSTGGLQLRSFQYETLQPLSIFTNDSCFGVEAPVVSERARQKYENCIRCAVKGPLSPSSIDYRIYVDFAHKYNVLVRGARK